VVEMCKVVVEVPEDLIVRIKKMPEIDWSLAVSRLVKQELERLARLKRIVAKSRLTEEKAVEISNKISESLAKRYEKLAE